MENNSTKRINKLNKELEQLRKENEKLNKAKGNSKINFGLHKQVIQKQRKEDERLRSIYNASNDAIFLVDPEHDRIIEVNPKACEMLEYSHNELLSIPISRVHPNEMELFSEFWKNLQSGGVGRSDKFTCTTKSNQVIPAEISASVLEIKGHKYLVTIIRDITERKQAELRLKGSQVKLKRLNKTLEKKVKVRTIELDAALRKQRDLNEMKSKFVSIASHEFRTPLSTILSSVDLVEIYGKSSDHDKRQKHIERIRSNIQNLKVILDDFLSLSKLEEGKVRGTPEVFDVVQFSEEMVDEMQKMVKPKLNIVYKHSGKIRKVNLDKNLLKNVLLNMLSNAIKYSPEGGDINFTSKLENSHFIFSIKDSGIGIPEEEQKHLFERFFRAKNAIHIQGTGLGLNIIKKYMDLMDRTIEFTSKENKGTTFLVKFPQKI